MEAKCYLQENDPPEDHDIERFSCVCGKCYEALANLHDAAQSALTTANARIAELEREREGLAEQIRGLRCTDGIDLSKPPPGPPSPPRPKHRRDFA